MSRAEHRRRALALLRAGHCDIASPSDLGRRFLASVEQTEGCWLWHGSVTTWGYGAFSVARYAIRSNRAAYELFVGPIPDGLYVLHSCDVRRCVNISHLHIGTHAENMQEMVQRGRSTSGERHRSRLYPHLNWSPSKIPDDVLAAALLDVLVDGMSHDAAAEKHGLCRSRISKTLRGEARRPALALARSLMGAKS